MIEISLEKKSDFANRYTGKWSVSRICQKFAKSRDLILAKVYSLKVHSENVVWSMRQKL